MNADLLSEAHKIQSTQARLRADLDALDSQVSSWIGRIQSSQNQAPSSPASVLPPGTPLSPAKPPCLPPPLPTRTAPQPAPPKNEAPKSRDQAEFRFGSVWMVRIGILLLLTGLVFLGNYTYEALSLHAGPLARLLILVTGSLGLLGTGLWFEKRPQTLRQFGHVLAGGGAAALYYCAYAAHSVPALRVVESAVAGQILLLGATAGILALSLLKNSQPLAVLTVVLSGYTAGLNPGGWTQVFLAAVAVLLLLRKGWSGVVQGGLFATFLSLAWMQHRWPCALQPGSVEAFWAQSWPVIACWCIFAAGCFLAKTPDGPWRVRVFTANNAALLALAAPGAAAVFDKGGAQFALSIGVVVLGLWGVARRNRLGILESASLAQGLLALSAGLVMFVGGYHSALVLAFEAAALAELSLRSRQERVLKAGSLLCAIAATGSGLLNPCNTPGAALWLCVPTAVLLIGTAWRFKQSRGLLQPAQWNGFAAPFTTGALLLGLRAANHLHSPLAPPGSLAALAMAAACALPVLRLPELAGPAIGYLLVALGFLFGSLGGPTPSGMVPVLSVAVVTLLCPMVLRKQRVWEFASTRADSLCLPPLALLTLFLHFWIPQILPQTQVGTALLATECAFLATGVLSNNRWATRFSVSFAAVGVLNLAIACCSAPHAMGIVPAPLPVALGVALQALIAGILALTGPGKTPAMLWTRFFRGQLWAATILGLLWALFFLQPGLQFLALTALASLVFWVAAWKPKEDWMAWAGGLFVSVWGAMLWRHLGLGFAHQILPCGTVGRAMADWIRDYLTPANWIAPLLLLGCQQFARRHPVPAPLFPAWAHRCLMCAGLGMLWWNAHHLVAACQLRGWITVVWSVSGAAFLAAGFALRERFYRRSGLLLLGFSVGRAFLVDVWRFDTLYRILSFLILGGLLVLFSFLYNRLADRESGASQTDQAS
jgi:uncharacterized membrane protein